MPGVVWALYLPFGRSTKVLACGVREVDHRARSRRPLYSGTGASRLRLRPRRLAALAALLAALSTAGCAYQLDTTLAKPDATTEQTGAIGDADRQVSAAKGVVPSEADLAYARAVAADVVGHGAKDSSLGRIPQPAPAAISRRSPPPTTTARSLAAIF